MPDVKPNVGLRPLAELKPYDNNAKMHDDAQVAKIAASIAKFGWKGNPIVVDENDVILAGHGRRLAALKLGLVNVPVEQVTTMTEDEKKAYRLADNRVAISNIDTDILQSELADLDFDMGDLFDKKELDFVVADLGELNTDAFVADLDSEIAAQTEETQTQIAESVAKPVPIAKALGFKSIRGDEERLVATWMAAIEEECGLTGADAFMALIRASLGETK